MNSVTLPVPPGHPPDTVDRQVLEIPNPAELRELSFANRLSLQLGVWLLLRAQRPRRRTSARLDETAHPRGLFLGERALTQSEAMALLTYDLQRQLR